MKKQIIKRNILFWGKYGLQLTAILLMFTVGYGVLFSFGSGLMGFWDSAFMYGTIIAILFTMIGPISYGGAYLPMVLSFGSGRREAVFGTQIENVISIVLGYLVILVKGFMRADRLQGWIFVLLAELMVFMCGLGQYALICQMKFGIKGMVVVIICAVAAFLAGLVIGLGYMETFMEMMNTNTKNMQMLIKIIGALIAGTAYISSTAVLLKHMKTYEVKA